MDEKKPVKVVDEKKTVAAKKTTRSTAEILKSLDIDASQHQPILRKVERGLFTLDQAIKVIKEKKE
jgi:hypothetical protein|tara:strand:- start:589 stop:786 length:198 start_codon:yes stop_codon:yes gene_type:complete